MITWMLKRCPRDVSLEMLLQAPVEAFKRPNRMYGYFCAEGGGFRNYEATLSWAYTREDVVAWGWALYPDIVGEEEDLLTGFGPTLEAVREELRAALVEVGIEVPT